MAADSLVQRVLALPSVPFTERTRRLPEQPGLYFAILDDSEILYIGMSRKSIRQRWRTWHIAVVHVNRYAMDGRVRIAYVVYRDVDRLKDDEKAALREFRPSLNLKDVPGAHERDRQRDAEACRWVDCDQHDHDRWPPSEPPTQVRPCMCVVHRSCARQGAAG